MTNNVKTPRYLEPSEIELWELARKSWPGPGGPETWREDFDRKNWQRACPASRDDALFISRCDPLTISSLLETLERTRGLLREFYDWRYVRQSWTSEDERVATQDAMYERAEALLSGFSGDASKQEE